MYRHARQGVSWDTCREIYKAIRSPGRRRCEWSFQSFLLSFLPSIFPRPPTCSEQRVHLKLHSVPMRRVLSCSAALTAELFSYSGPGAIPEHFSFLWGAKAVEPILVLVRCLNPPVRPASEFFKKLPWSFVVLSHLSLFFSSRLTLWRSHSHHLQDPRMQRETSRDSCIRICTLSEQSGRSLYFKFLCNEKLL